MDSRDFREDRVWGVLLAVGGAFAALLLARQIADFLADSHRPALAQNDAIAALGSVVMLAIVGVVAVRRFAPARSSSGARASRPRTKRGTQ
jgi:hypothetical protein